MWRETFNNGYNKCNVTYKHDQQATPTIISFFFSFLDGVKKYKYEDHALLFIFIIIKLGQCCLLHYSNQQQQQQQKK